MSHPSFVAAMASASVSEASTSSPSMFLRSPSSHSTSSLSSSSLAPQRKLDFTRFGYPTKEWREFVAAHPVVEHDSDKLPMRTTDAAANTELPEGVRDAQKAGLYRSINPRPDEGVVGEEKTIRSGGGNGEQGRLTAMVYTKILGPDDLKLDKGTPCVVYFHSGGYGLLGQPTTESYLCSQMATRLRVVVVHVNYRECPPNYHPDAHEDAWDSVRWVVEHADKLGVNKKEIILVGMCYGAGLAASVTARAVAEGDSSDVKIKGQVMAFPWLFQEDMFPYDMFVARGATSRYQCAAAPTMTKRVYDDLQRKLRVMDQSDPLLNVPLAPDETLAKFPRTGLIMAGMDLLRDDGILFGERLRQLGVKRRVHLFTGMPHAFRRYADLWASKRFDQVLLVLINWALERTMSMDDSGFHVEQQPEEQPQPKQQQQQREACKHPPSPYMRN